MTLIKHFKFFKKQPQQKDLISKLPQEILSCIYQHLETKDSTLEFSRTCRAFYRLSLDPRSKASWIVTRFGTRFAVYYALLCIPQKCTMQFLQMMLNMGATVPSHIVQNLLRFYGKYSEPSPRRRRASYFDDLIQLQQDFFKNQIQKIPFEGYVFLLVQQQDNQCIKDQDNLTLFFSSLEKKLLAKQSEWKDMIRQEYFFPAPMTERGCYRQLVRLAQSSPDDYRLIAPVFEFDPVARASLWEAILMVLFDEAFRTSELSSERMHTLVCIQSIVRTKIELVGPLDDQKLFCQVFNQFFTKYPAGYCNQTTMNRFLSLLTLHAKPTSFNVQIALEFMVRTNLGRTDTIDAIDTFLRN